MAVLEQDDLVTDDAIDSDTETSTVEFNIVVTATDWSLDQLASMFWSDDIVVPDYQRKYVWDVKRASKLIESFAIGLPVPQVFFYENTDGQLEVIDGQQRITSIAYSLKVISVPLMHREIEGFSGFLVWSNART